MAQLFKDFPLAPELHKALEELKFTEPTDIQAKALPLLMGTERVDFHGQAQTGTGKTLAFGLPLIQDVSARDKSVQALIVAPTRELVLQICEALEAAAKFKPIKIDAIYGGVSIERQVGALKRGVQIVVGTPGRLNDLLRRKQLKLDKLKTLVLDEADIMLDMGFKEEVDDILKFAPKDRQIWLFSATVKPGIMAIKRTHMNNPVSVKAEQQVATKQTKQYFCVAPSRNRLDVLCRLVDCAPGFYGMIFCRTKILTAEVSDELLRRGYGAKSLHGDLSQIQRNRVIKKFKDKEFPVLVATDVAARGIDVSDLTHVINYSLPEDQESYVHRIGRTGRAGKEGIAITLIGQRDGSRLKRLARRFNVDIKPLEVPQLDDIIQARVSTAIDHFETATTQASPFNGQLDGLKDTLKNYSADQLVSGVVNLLSDKFLKGYENQKDSGFKSAGLIDGGPDVEEVCLSVGTDDGVSYEDVLQLLLKKAELTEGQIQKLRVINRRSFITVSHDLSSKILRGLRGVEIGGRKIRMHVTQEDDSQRRRPSRPSRGGSGGGGYRRSGGSGGGGGGGYRGGGSSGGRRRR